MHELWLDLYMLLYICFTLCFNMCGGQWFALTHELGMTLSHASIDFALSLWGEDAWHNT